MYCYQCQETVRNQGCTVRGVCGKSEEVAVLQDLLVYLLKGISVYATKARELGAVDEGIDDFVHEGLFSTITNVNFDADRMVTLVKRALRVRDRAMDLFLIAYREKNGAEFPGELPDAATWTSEGHLEELLAKGRQVGVMATENEDIRSLKQLLTYGLKGMSAYAHHAGVLGERNEDVDAFVQRALVATLDDSLGVDDLVGLTLECGKHGVDVLALLDGANTSTYGHPEPTEVATGTRKGPGILVSGHDLRDLEDLLKQTDGRGINVYTHGEMLPANAYPGLKKYPHLAGNYGSSWFRQRKEFEQFTGAILMTTNCIQAPKESYKDRIFTTGTVAWPEVQHIPDRQGDASKDFSPVIAEARARGDLEERPGKSVTIGFAHNTLGSVADKVVEAVKSGAIKRFVVMAGCDGRHKEREYYTDVAKKLPKDTVILTAGCAKYRYNMEDLGDIGGIPRVIDAGQCNDSYSLAVTALKLAEVFKVKDINDLPISYDIGWYEQKAVLVLLTLLHLGVKGIRLGPTLPAFLSPNVAKVLVDNFDIKLAGTAEEDVKAMMEGR